MTRGVRAAYCYAAHAQDIAGFVETPGVHEEARVYALVDAGQRPAAASRLARLLNGVPQARLFRGKFANDAESLSPLLVQLPKPMGGHGHIEALSSACEGMPMLSFIASFRRLDELARSLQALLVIETESGKGYLLRIADTLAMRAAIQAATPQQRASMLEGVLAWWTADTRGQVSDLRAEFAVDEPTGVRLPLSFSDEQMHALIDASWVPITAAQLRAIDQPFADRRLAEQHDFVARMARRSTGAGFTSEADLLAWCTAALRGGDLYDEHPLVAMAFLETRMEPAPQRLSTALALLDDDSWSEIRGWSALNQPDMP